MSSRWEQSGAPAGQRAAHARLRLDGPAGFRTTRTLPGCCHGGPAATRAPSRSLQVGWRQATRIPDDSDQLRPCLAAVGPVSVPSAAAAGAGRRRVLAKCRVCIKVSFSQADFPARGP